MNEETGGLYSTCEDENFTGSVKGRNHPGDLRVNWEIVSEQILEKQGENGGWIQLAGNSVYLWKLRVP
jgi:hypothetical protein